MRKIKFSAMFFVITGTEAIVITQTTKSVINASARENPLYTADFCQLIFFISSPLQIIFMIYLLSDSFEDILILFTVTYLILQKSLRGGDFEVKKLKFTLLNIFDFR